jgi:hypothetical protein
LPNQLALHKLQLLLLLHQVQHSLLLQGSHTVPHSLLQQQQLLLLDLGCNYRKLPLQCQAAAAAWLLLPMLHLAEVAVVVSRYLAMHHAAAAECGELQTPATGLDQLHTAPANRQLLLLLSCRACQVAAAADPVGPLGSLLHGQLRQQPRCQEAHFFLLLYMEHLHVLIRQELQRPLLLLLLRLAAAHLLLLQLGLHCPVHLAPQPVHAAPCVAAG